MRSGVGKHCVGHGIIDTGCRLEIDCVFEYCKNRTGTYSCAIPVGAWCELAQIFLLCRLECHLVDNIQYIPYNQTKAFHVKILFIVEELSP